jgi:hypothetical protein
MARIALSSIPILPGEWEDTIAEVLRGQGHEVDDEGWAELREADSSAYLIITLLVLDIALRAEAAFDLAVRVKRALSNKWRKVPRGEIQVLYRPNGEVLARVELDGEDDR